MSEECKKWIKVGAVGPDGKHTLLWMRAEEIDCSCGKGVAIPHDQDFESCVCGRRIHA